MKLTLSTFEKGRKKSQLQAVKLNGKENRLTIDILNEKADQQQKNENSRLSLDSFIQCFIY